MTWTLTTPLQQQLGLATDRKREDLVPIIALWSRCAGLPEYIEQIAAGATYLLL
jgi:hypothetical protein